MINTRKAAVLGIGFGTLAIATIGLLPDTTPIIPPSGGGGGGYVGQNWGNIKSPITIPSRKHIVNIKVDFNDGVKHEVRYTLDTFISPRATAIVLPVQQHINIIVDATYVIPSVGATIITT